MAGPVITTLLSPNPASGTWAPSDNSTETTLASGTAVSGTFTLRMDMNNQADGDTIELALYTKAGATERLYAKYSLGPLAPTEKIHIGPSMPTAEDYKVTAKLTAGSTSSRSFPWSVLNLNGT